MLVPEVFVFDGPSESAAANDLATQIAALGISAPFVLMSEHGRALASKIEGPAEHLVRPDGADQAWASRLGSEAKRSGADAIIAIGGGRCLDVGKLAAARSGLIVIAVPTQLSHDGICSPVAVVPDASGRAQSLGALEPRAVYVALPTISGAPKASVRAGIGDLLANPLALRDWALAAERGLEEIDQRAWDLSSQSFEAIEPFLDRDVDDLAGDAGFLEALAHALVLSGTSMICAGTSRPASGAEHEISHAIDHLFGGRAHHGAQVAFGTIFSVALHGEDIDGFIRRLVHLGLPASPGDLGLTHEDTAKVLLEAPDTRPGRFTVLEDANLDNDSALELVDRIWPTPAA